MEKILLVCLGNICRSALAEGVFLHLIEKHNLQITIDSAGTSGYHIGEPPDSRTISNARKHNIDISGLRARQFSMHDFDAFDKIYVMDASNKKNVLNLAKTENHKSKVDLFLNILHPEKNLEVPDPYYGGDEGFEDVFQMVYATCEKWIEDYKLVNGQ